MTYVIALPCVDLLDKTCIDECPVDCIYEGERMLYIHPDECVDCGACEPICPVEAISFEADVPAQWKGFYRINVEFFDELGSPGGGSRVGKTGRDHPVVAALPPKDKTAGSADLGAGERIRTEWTSTRAASRSPGEGCWWPGRCSRRPRPGCGGWS